MKTDVVQKAIVLNEAGHMLVLRRSGTDVRRPHQCDLPGGELEANEDLLEGMRREIKEETGLTVRDVRPIYSFSEIKTWHNDGEDFTSNIVRIIYVAKAESTDVVLSYEHEEHFWLPIEEAIVKYDYPVHQKILQYVIDNKLIN